ncbi:Kazal-type serine protease inhibitor domain-containing protein [Roseinatronobacter alkalisoli]|uniref:Kazal-type serine protease inhibitor domain-containing protein n=1 Tax=Roseinatronobacter alkalisoli TaxID=3028235 RepID=A0ABT5TCK4_9RHOB|nr:Kazal-type serine protease inhibitor domain-containing protein [Roseinatronobacter sp. HJB301]MDD7972726.1 Kazal-type serine protease inhibitor domain-containing protein [Roseinatronobacter sp. HJB301]
MRTAFLFAAVVAFLATCVPETGPYPPPHEDRPAACTFEYPPVCGERHGQRETYGNACMMRAADARLVHQGQCRPATVSPRPPGGREQACTREYAPVCAVRQDQRRSFANACEAEAAQFRVVRRGECRG